MGRDWRLKQLKSEGSGFRGLSPSYCPTIPRPVELTGHKKTATKGGFLCEPNGRSVAVR